MSSDPDLPPRSQAFYDLLAGKGDVSFHALYIGYFGTMPPKHDRVQQYLGNPVTRLNRRLRKHGQRVVPGHARETYRLITL
jgi:Uma2 family endonuclease